MKYRKLLLGKRTLLALAAGAEISTQNPPIPAQSLGWTRVRPATEGLCAFRSKSPPIPSHRDRTMCVEGEDAGDGRIPATAVWIRAEVPAAAVRIRPFGVNTRHWSVYGGGRFAKEPVGGAEGLPDW